MRSLADAIKTKYVGLFRWIMKRYFRCTVCDDIHYGENAPEICPTCETMGSYVGVTKDEAEEYFL